MLVRIISSLAASVDTLADLRASVAMQLLDMVIELDHGIVNSHHTPHAHHVHVPHTKELISQ
jgi:hypothetical protein